MAGRPFWSGQIRISLVSFGIQLYPATESQAGISFHQIDRKTGQRVRHQNVTDDQESVEYADIVKGYEYSKGEYLIVTPEEIENLRIESKSTIDVQQFVDLSEIPFAFLEKPYFVVPEPKESIDAFAIVREAMEQSGKVAIGEITFGGREHLVAVSAASGSEGRGMMAYLLRYGEELRKEQEYFSHIPVLKKQEIDKKQLAMATQLIEAYSRPFDPEAFHDDYEAALRELIEAKQKNIPLPAGDKKAKSAKVVNLMDALRESVSKAKKPVGSERHVARGVSRKGPVLVKESKRKHRVA